MRRERRFTLTAFRKLEKKTTKPENEKQVVGFMIALYCKGKHGSKNGELCPECEAVYQYAAHRVDVCPYMATKTFCSNCRTHCYKPDVRDSIRAVMRYSAPRMLYYHPLMAVKHVRETIKEKKRLAEEEKGKR